MPVPIALLRAFVAAVAAAPHDGLKLFLEQRLDRCVDVLPQPILDGIVAAFAAQ